LNGALFEDCRRWLSYTPAKSLDDYTQDSTSRALLVSSSQNLDRGPSDFDVRQAFAGTVTYDIPTLLHNGWGNKLARNWSIDSIFNARSARPVNVVYGMPTIYGLAYLRPDLVGGVPLYLFDSAVAGGRRINPAAFLAPANEQQGTLGRNSLRGFPLYQIDLALRRSFKLREGFNLQLEGEAFNLFNHPNFADPLGSDTSIGSKFDPVGALHPNASFGQSASLNGRSILAGGTGGFGSYYSAGGPRALRFSAKLTF
jgi:hypothetical protein